MNRENPAPYIAVAPMMDWTDRHCRYFHRLIAPRIHLFTEMVTTGALLHGDRDRFLRFHPAEHPVTLQLGGGDPAELARCARMGEQYGYNDINLNCGCPSDRVQSGHIGACLMTQPAQVAKAMDAMIQAVSIPVTVKCRISIDEYKELPFLNKFIEEVSKAGCQTFVIHARKAWLQGLSPKENRSKPPLRYDIVEEIKSRHPHLNIILNGGIKTRADIDSHLQIFDGVMIGREAYRNPYFLAAIEQTFFDNQAVLPRETVARAMIPYIKEQQKEYGTPVKSVTRHMLGLFQGRPGAKAWKRHLSENAHKENSTPDIIEEALGLMPQTVKSYVA